MLSGNWVAVGLILAAIILVYIRYKIGDHPIVKAIVDVATFGAFIAAILVFVVPPSGIITPPEPTAPPETTNTIASPNTPESEPTAIPTDVPTPEPKATLLGGASRIAFVSDRGGRVEQGGNLELYTMNVAGGDVTRLTNSPGNEWDPAWSPDGERVAFVYEEENDGNVDIYVVNCDGSGRINLTHNAAEDRDAFWSPDGSFLLFSSDRSGNREIYRMDPNGNGVDRVTDTPNDDWNPALSPDGERIVFVNGTYSNLVGNICVIDAAGGGDFECLTSGMTDGAPVWSPDGARIAFHSRRDGEWQIYVMNADGSGLINLNVRDGRFPVWSPDGSKLTFVSGFDGDREVYVMDADGSNIVRLTTVPGWDWNPVWSPE